MKQSLTLRSARWVSIGWSRRSELAREDGQASENTLLGDEVEFDESQFGPIVLVGLALAATIVMPVFSAESSCSQLYVIGSPSGSVAEPVSLNGVIIGMV